VTPVRRLVRRHQPNVRLVRYEDLTTDRARVAELAPPDLLAWLHAPPGAAGP